MRGRELIKGQRFHSWRRVGNAMQSARVHNMRNVDELIMLEISGKLPDLDVVSDLAKECFMPLTIGGGVRTVEDFGKLLHAGADKVAVCSMLFNEPDLIGEAAFKFGSQAVVAAIDIRQGHFVINKGKQAVTGPPIEWATFAAMVLGAGEILLTSVDKEGTMQGYDLDLVRDVAKAVDIPVVAHGGCGNYDHMVEALEAGAHAVAAGAMFQFTERTPLEAARYLSEHGFPTREGVLCHQS